MASDGSNKKKKSKKKNVVEEEIEIDLEAELYEALTELKAERKKNKKLNEQYNEATELISQLQVSTEESKKIASDLNNELSSKSNECTRLEEEILRLEVELASSMRENSQLKVTTEESKKIANDLNSELSSKSDECAKLEEEILRLEAELANSVRENRSYMEATTSSPSNSSEKTATNQEGENDCSQMEEENILDEILSCQRSPHIKSGLGYEKQGTEQVQGKGSAENPIVFVRAKQMRSNDEKQAENRTGRDGTSKGNQNRQRKHDRNLRQRESFRGYCYGCNAYGHRVAECRRQERPPVFTSRNRFASLAENNIECFRCQRFGHIARNCQTLLPSQRQPRGNMRRNTPRRSAPREERVMKEKARKPITVKEKAVWVEKSKIMGNKSFIVQATPKAKNRPTPWILDSGCSTHMSGDREIFSSLNTEAGGSVRFGNNDGARIQGRGMVNICSAQLKSQKVLLVNGLKHNLLSVSQVCDQGNEVTFTKNGFTMKNVENGKVVAQGKRTQGNLYVLSEN